jgi:type II secretory pathway pseudopilin PulG
MTPTRIKQEGFTYLALLFFVAIAGIMVSAEGALWSIEKQRGKERALLFAGNEIKRAICLYYERSPGTVKRYPKSLEDLLLDNRQLGTTRYLRRIYVDPMTGKPDWVVMRSADGGVKGISSRSNEYPMRKLISNKSISATAAATSYAEWVFQYEPGPVSASTVSCAHMTDS